jgi:hypothetical protein
MGDYANRFLELPLIQTRFLSWINYRYGATGRMDYGFNFWSDNPRDFSSDTREGIPAGDPWMVYPGDEKVYSSLRLEAQRDGIADYELLKLLEKTAPEKAQALAAAVIQDFDRYDSDIRTFRKTRLKLLELLSE